MADETTVALHDPDRTREIAHDLREFARAGVEPVYASKLLSAAAELDILALRPKRPPYDGGD